MNQIIYIVMFCGDNMKQYRMDCLDKKVHLSHFPILMTLKAKLTASSLLATYSVNNKVAKLDIACC